MLNNYELNVDSSDCQLFFDSRTNAFKKLHSDKNYFSFLTVTLFDRDINKIVLTFNIALAKEYLIRSKKMLLPSAFRSISSEMAENAEKLISVVSYKKHSEVTEFDRVGVITNFYIFNTDCENAFVFIIKDLDKILKNAFGINLRFVVLKYSEIKYPDSFKMEAVLSKSTLTYVKGRTHLIGVYIPNPNSKIK